MQIDKQQIISMLQGLGQQDKAGAAKAELPDQVDTDAHAGLLDKLGINVSDVLGMLGGQNGEQGGIAGKRGL